MEYFKQPAEVTLFDLAYAGQHRSSCSSVEQDDELSYYMTRLEHFTQKRKKKSPNNVHEVEKQFEDAEVMAVSYSDVFQRQDESLRRLTELGMELSEWELDAKGMEYGGPPDICQQGLFSECLFCSLLIRVRSSRHSFRRKLQRWHVVRRVSRVASQIEGRNGAGFESAYKSPFGGAAARLVAAVYK